MAVAVVVVVAVAAATQDIATDAIAVRLLSPAERGMGNGIQKAGGYVGLMAGGGGALVVYDRFGWMATVLLLAALTALPLPALLRFREPPPPAMPGRLPIPTSPIRSFFRRPGTPRWVFVVLPLYVLGMALSLPLLTPMLVDAGWPLDRIGLLSLLGGSSIALLCALATGAVLSVTRRRRALIGGAVAQVVAIGALLVLAHTSGSVPVAILAVALLNGSYAAAGTVVYTMSMDRSRAEFAGTDFTVQDSLIHLLSQVAGAVGLWTAGTVGYPTTLTCALVIALCGAAALTRVFCEAEPCERAGEFGPGTTRCRPSPVDGPEAETGTDESARTPTVALPPSARVEHRWIPAFRGWARAASSETAHVVAATASAQNRTGRRPAT